MIYLQIEIRPNYLEEDGSIDGYEWIILQRKGYGASWEETNTDGFEPTLEAAASKAIHDFKVLKERLGK